MVENCRPCGMQLSVVGGMIPERCQKGKVKMEGPDSAAVFWPQRTQRSTKHVLCPLCHLCSLWLICRLSLALSSEIERRRGIGNNSDNFLGSLGVLGFLGNLAAAARVACPRAAMPCNRSRRSTPLPFVTRHSSLVSSGRAGARPSRSSLVTLTSPAGRRAAQPGIRRRTRRRGARGRRGRSSGTLSCA